MSIKGYTIDCNYIIRVKDYMLPCPRLKRPKLKIPIFTVEIGVLE